MFKGLKDSFGESAAKEVLLKAKAINMKPSSARLLFDDDGVAHIEVNELATSESLEAIISSLHNFGTKSKGIKAAVLHVEGIVAPDSLHSHMLVSGAFIMGLRTTGLPIILSASGTIAGPSWGLVLAADYRIATQSTTFVLPILRPPECLGDLVGGNVAVELCYSVGPMPALNMLELGVLNQVQKGKEESGKAGEEFAKRLAGFPSIAMRQTLGLLCPPVERYMTATL